MNFPTLEQVELTGADLRPCRKLSISPLTSRKPPLRDDAGERLDTVTLDPVDGATSKEWLDVTDEVLR
jgi:hypothetical protein